MEKQTEIISRVHADWLVTSLALAGLALVLRHCLELRQSLGDRLAEANITGRCNPDILIFNRVPKVGSQTLNHIIAELRAHNNFTGFTSLDGMPTNGDNSEDTFFTEPSFVNMTIDVIAEKSVELHRAPFAFLKHQNFLDFNSRGHRSPVYINFVRHPVERLISWYYYIRQAWYQLDVDEARNVSRTKVTQLSVRELKTPIEECFGRGLKGCRPRPGMRVHNNFWLPDHASQMAFFCGQAPECDRWETDELLAAAKRNVETHFAVVGVLERWDESLAVLEAYIPRYFADVRQIYAANETIRHVNKNDFKPVVSPDFKRQLSSHLTKEIEFYHFCKQRLRKQYLLIN